MDDLEVGLVPLEEFACRRWFYASPLWYYHRPAPLPPLKLDRHFYELVDPDLRELCAMLHSAGVGTTPSCQGHFHRLVYFRGVWEVLQWQRDAIRGEGLLVRASETEEPLLFASRGYELPWGSFGRFYEAVASRQQQGYLGVRLQLSRWRLWERLMRETHGQTSARFAADGAAAGGAWTLHVSVQAANPQLQALAWRGVQHHLRGVLRRPDTSVGETAGLFGS